MAAVVDHDALARRRDAAHRLVQLLAAVAPARVEDVAGETLGVDPGQHTLLPGNVAVYQCYQLGTVEARAVSVGTERPVLSWKIGFDLPDDAEFSDATIEVERATTSLSNWSTAGVIAVPDPENPGSLPELYRSNFAIGLEKEFLRLRVTITP